MKFANSVSKREMIATTRIIAVNFAYKKTLESTDNQEQNHQTILLEVGQ